MMKGAPQNSKLNSQRWKKQQKQHEFQIKIPFFTAWWFFENTKNNKQVISFIIVMVLRMIFW